MDQQLKQRLIGVTIVVALVVIFVPMLFERSDDKGKFSSTGIPPIPDDVMEQTIELPKTAEEVGPQQEEQKPPVDEGYKLVPMNEEPPPKAKPVEESTETAKPEPTTVEATKPVVVEGEPEEKPIQPKPGKKIKHVLMPAVPTKLAPDKPQGIEKTVASDKHSSQPKSVTVNRKPKTGASKSTRSTIDPTTNADVQDAPPARVKSQNSANKAKPSSAASTKPLDATEPKSVVSKKIDTLKAYVARHRAPKEIKPKTSAPAPTPETDRDLDEEPVPAPAKPETAQSKPKQTVGITNPKPTMATKKNPDTVKKSNIAKPSESKPSTVKVEKPKTAPNPALSQPKPKPKPKPVPTEPAKSADPDKLKPQTMVPGGSTGKAESFAAIIDKLLDCATESMA